MNSLCLICGAELDNIYPDDIDKPESYNGTRYYSAYLVHSRRETFVICDLCSDKAKEDGRLFIVDLE